MITRPRYGQLTSLVDVLFILLFASLVQQRRGAEASAAEAGASAESEASAAAPIDAGPPPPPDAAPVADEPEADPHATARAVQSRLDASSVVLVAVDASGRITSIERDGERLDLDLPLLRETGDDRVVVFVADQRPALRLCLQLEGELGVSLDGALILVSTRAPIRRLPFALVEGLRRDVKLCADDTGANALLVRTDVPEEPAP